MARDLQHASRLGRAPLGRGEVMMRYLATWVFVLALAIVPFAGCGGCGGTGDGDGGNGGNGGAGGSGGVSGCNTTRGVTCICDQETSPEGDCNRIHLDNINFQAGIGVELVAPNQTCTIGELMVDDPGPGFELDQCVMNLAVGDTLEIKATWLGNPATKTCVVDETANVPGIEGELQTFADVFAEAPQLSVFCGGGFVE